MQPLEELLVFDGELAALGFEKPLEGRIEAAILRRWFDDEGLRSYFIGGMLPVETEELEAVAGSQAKTLYLAKVATREVTFPGDTAELHTDWMAALALPRRASSIGTGGLMRDALVNRLKSVLLGDSHARLEDEDGPLTEGMAEWAAVNAPKPTADNALLRTLVPFTLRSNINATSREWSPGS